jgi:hypothetical protein
MIDKGVLTFRIETTLTAEGLNIVNRSFGDVDARHQLDSVNLSQEHISKHMSIQQYLNKVFKVLTSKPNLPVKLSGGITCYIDNFEQYSSGVICMIKVIDE